MSAIPLLVEPTVLQRMTWILEGLCQTIAACAGRKPTLSPLALVLWPYLRRLAGRFERLLTRLPDGRPPRAPAARSPSASPAPKDATRLPQGHAWLIRRMRETAGFGSQLRQLLSDPDIAALLETDPRFVRLLRPLCRMLGIGPAPDLPAVLFPLRRRRPRPSPAAAADAVPETPPCAVPKGPSLPPATAAPSVLSLRWPRSSGRRLTRAMVRALSVRWPNPA